jgi:hypothetical protein
MKVSAGRPIDVYEPSGSELRIHWNIIEKTREESDGTTTTYWEADEALCDVAADRATLIETIIGAEYSMGREFAAINNREDDPEAYAAYQAFRAQAKVLADGWLHRA